MATILPFVIRRGPSSRARLFDASASIIIFPGVRYERPLAEERQKNPAASTRKRKGKTR